MRTLMALLVFASVLAAALPVLADPAEPPAAVALEVEIVEIVGGGQGETDDKLLARVREAVAAGKAKSTTRVRLTTLAGQQARLQFGQQEAVATGRTRFGGGGRDAGAGGQAFAGTTSYSYQNHGTLLQATPTVDAEGAIRVQLQIEQSRLARAAPTADMKEPEAPPGTSTLTTHTAVALRAGKPTVVAVLTGAAAGEETLTVVVASGSVLK